MTALRDELRALALHLATIDRRAAAATAVTHVLHELGNPTAVLLGNLRFVGDALTQLAGAIDSSQASAVEARQLVGELRGAIDDAMLGAQELTARIDRFRLSIDEPRTATVGGAADDSADLARVVEASCELVAPLLAPPSRGVAARLERRLPASLPRVAAPTAHLIGVVLQLLLNGLEADAACITVGAHPVEGGRARVALTVDDDGAGVADAIRPRLAHPLVSSKTGAARGLGLASARATLERLGGELQVMHPTAGGTSVRVLLPAVR